VAIEDGSIEKKELYINRLVNKLNIKEDEAKRIKDEAISEYGPDGNRRTGNIVRNILKVEENEGEEYKGSKLKALIKMFGFIKDYKKIYITSIILLTIMCIIEVINPIIIRHIIDNVFTIEKYNVFIVMLVGFSLFGLGLRLIAVVTRFISGKYTVRTAQLASRDIKNKVYKYLTLLPFSYYDKNKTGELVSICTSDINSVTRTFAMVNARFVRIVVTFLGAFIIMFSLNHLLALISLISFPLIILISMFFFGLESKAYEKYQKQEAKMSAVLQENLTGVRVVKAFARQEFEKEKFEEENKDKFKKGKYLMSIHALFWPITDIIGTIQICISLIIGSIFAINNIITLGTIVAFIQYLFMIIFPMKILGNVIVELGKASVSWKRIHLILDSKSDEIYEGHKSDKKINVGIEFKNVNFMYEKNKPVIKNLNFKIKPGEKVAFIGHTGCGKSTIMNLMSNFYPIDSGEILIDGKNINDYARVYLNDQIGFIHQEAFLFSKSIKDNIAFARQDATDEEIKEAAKMADVHEAIESFPNGYETMVGEKGVTLSGGQKQRVAIARTILKDPAILILDDSLSAVDTETEARIQKAMDKIMEGRTTIIIGHRITSIMKADKIIVLENGEVIQQGNHEELVKEKGIYKSIFNIQTSIEEEIEREVSTNV
jgi:ATP-binding cassette, subfamily B, bacterial